jgi:glutathione peroxidase-family protein
VFKLSKCGIKRSFRTLRGLYNKSIYQMSAILGVPLEQIKRWDTREEKCPDFIIELIKTRIENDL